MEIWNFGIVRPPKFGILEFWKFGILEIWNFGIVRPQKFGILEIWNCGIMELIGPKTLETWNMCTR